MLRKSPRLTLRIMSHFQAKSQGVKVLGVQFVQRRPIPSFASMTMIGTGPGEIVIPAKAGIHRQVAKPLDTGCGFGRNSRNYTARG